MNKKLAIEKALLSFVIFFIFYIIAFYALNITNEAFVNTLSELGNNSIPDKELATYKMYVYGTLGVFITLVLGFSIWGILNVMRRKKSIFSKKGDKNA